MSGPEQIVVTGVGLATSLGLSARETWEGVLGRRPGMGPMPALESPLPDGHTGGQAAELPADYAPGLPREVRYLRWSVEEAWRQAGLHDRVLSRGLAPERIAIILGTTLHGIRQGGAYLRTGDHRPLEHFLAGSIIEDALGGLPIGGPAITTCSACSSGLASIALGMTLLRAGKVDVVIAGGYDPVSEYVYAGFNSLRLVAAGHLMPFTKGRDGMKLAEGYAITVIERADDAAARGAAALATLLGYGESSDAHHLTQPQPEGEGAARAARAALAMGKVSPDQIGLCSAHATATPNNDAAEFAAMRTVLGDHEPPVVAFKSHLGHTLGAAGAAELILSLMALRDGVVPPTANVDAQNLEFPISLNCAAPRPQAIQATMNMSLGFGGANTCMVMGAPQPRDAHAKRHAPSSGRRTIPVLITGIGVIAPGALGNTALRERFSEADPTPISQDGGTISDESLAQLLNARRVRRMSEYEKLTLAAAAEAFTDAGITDIAAFSAECGAILGSMLGSTSFSESYYRQIVSEGLAAANPMLFAEGVPNAAAAQLSMVYGIKGGCQTVIGTRTSGLDALWLAAQRIAAGEWDRAVVSAGEEFHALASEVWDAWGYRAGPKFVGSARAGRGFFSGSGAAAIILESQSSASARERSPRGRIDVDRSGAASARGVAGLATACERLVRALGPVDGILTSGNGTWLDRVEHLAMRRASYRGAVGSVEGYLPELLSVGPLAGLGAALLTGRLPRHLFGKDPGDNPRVRAMGLLATDFAGLASAVRVTVEPPEA